MNQIIERLLNEPALLVGLVRAGIILLVTFGIQITADQQDAILGFIGILLAVISLALTGVTRALVVPARQVEEPATPEGSG